jgi:hypothetical protein
VSVLDGPTRIGIWELDHHSGRYERLPGEWPHWADVAAFDLVPRGKRVLYFGESAARGFFYDPVVTPALLIERCLKSSGSERIEVLDLARVGARSEAILDVARSSRHLAPDVVIAFAGNNWKFEVMEGLPGAARSDEAHAVAEGGVAGLLRHRERLLARLGQHFVEEICQIFDGVAPVVFVIPESNLVDWTPEPLAPTLGGGRDLGWQRWSAELERAWRAGDEDGVLECCATLHSLDGGISDLAHRRAADIQLRRGKTEEALAGYRRARDVRLWYDITDLAWLPSAGADAARKAAAESGAQIVDLPEILPGCAKSGVPDRSIFLDSCHFNSTGLRVVAAEIACHTAPILDLALTAQECAAALPDIDPTVEGGAQFCAAVAQAEFGQPAERIEFHAQAAVQAEPAALDAMARFCAAPGSPAPWWMRPRQFLDVGNVRRFVYGFGFVGRYRYNPALVRAFTAQMARVHGQASNNSGRPSEPDNGDVAQPSRSLAPNMRTELLDPIFAPAWSPAGWDGVFAVHGARRHYYRSYSDTTCLTLELAVEGSLELEITARLGTSGAGMAEVAVNNHVAGEIVLTPRWQRTEFYIEPNVLLIGQNALELRWRRSRLDPAPFPVLARRIEEGLPQELGVVVGEVFSVRATIRPATNKVTASVA